MNVHENDLWGYDEDGSRYAEITEDELNKTVARFREKEDEIERLRAELKVVYKTAQAFEDSHNEKRNRIDELLVVNKKHLATIAGIVIYLKMNGIDDRVEFLEDYLRKA